MASECKCNGSTNCSDEWPNIDELLGKFQSALKDYTDLMFRPANRAHPEDLGAHISAFAEAFFAIASNFDIK